MTIGETEVLLSSRMLILAFLAAARAEDPAVPGITDTDFARYPSLTSPNSKKGLSKKPFSELVAAL
ncbi:hypothetical protein D3C86_2097250 [compost metagenome]